MMKESFWENKTLEELTTDEWERLCDGCAICCLQKVEDADTGEVFYLNEACELLDRETGRCMDYHNRHVRVPDCAELTPEAVREFDWLPETCAYRCLAENRPLPEWHPLLEDNE